MGFFYCLKTETKIQTGIIPLKQSAGSGHEITFGPITSGKFTREEKKSTKMNRILFVILIHFLKLSSSSDKSASYIIELRGNIFTYIIFFFEWIQNFECYGYFR